MAKLYRKRTFRRKRVFRRSKRSYGRKRRGGFKRAVKKVINSTAEKKAIQTIAVQQSVSNSGSFIIFNGSIPQGTASNQRVGNEVQIRSIKVWNEAYLLNTAVDIARIRIICGIWHDYQTSTPTIAKILEGGSAGYTVAPFLRSGLQAKWWTPLYDRQIILTPKGQDEPGGMRLKQWKFGFHGKRIKRGRIMYNSTGNPQEAYFMLVMSGEIGVPFPVHGYSYRVTYTDV